MSVTDQYLDFYENRKGRHCGCEAVKQGHMRLVPITILALLSGIVGCNNVRSAELSGTWLMTDASRQVLPTGLQQTSATIVLDANGTFVASNMPGLLFFPGHRDARPESGRGTWKLVSREGKQQVQFDFEEIADWNKNELPYGTQLDISRGWSSLSLYYFLGDADEGRRIEFERQK